MSLCLYLFKFSALATSLVLQGLTYIHIYMLYQPLCKYKIGLHSTTKKQDRLVMGSTHLIASVAGMKWATGNSLKIDQAMQWQHRVGGKSLLFALHQQQLSAGQRLDDNIVLVLTFISYDIHIPIDHIPKALLIQLYICDVYIIMRVLSFYSIISLLFQLFPATVVPPSVPIVTIALLSTQRIFNLPHHRGTGL